MFLHHNFFTVSISFLKSVLNTKKPPAISVSSAMAGGRVELFNYGLKAIPLDYAGALVAIAPTI